MDPQNVIKMVNMLKHINEKQSSQVYTNEVWFEFVDVNRNNVSSEMTSALKHFEEVSNIDIAKNYRPALVVSKRRTSTSNDVSVNLDASNISFRKRDKYSSSGGSSGEPSFAGSPLKVEAFADLSAFPSPLNISPVSHRLTDASSKKHFVGLDLQEARCLLTLYTISCKDIMASADDTCVKRIPSIWILCNPLNRLPSRSSKSLPVVMLGAEPVPKTSDVHHPRLRLTKIMSSVKSTDNIDRFSFPFSKNTSDIVCQAKYDLMENQNSFDDGYTGVLKVLLEWKGANRLLENFPSEANATVFASITSGYAQSSAHSLHVELTVLKNVFNAVSSGDIVWLGSDQKEPLIESVRNLVRHINETDVLDADDDTDADGADKPSTTNISLDSRLDTDFTDELWKVLIRCSSMSDLVQSLQYVFTCLKNGEIQPGLHERNQTTMANLVRDSYRNKMIVPTLKGVTPLTIMAEMGIEKLLWDYATFFVSSGLVPLSSLTSYMKQSLDQESKIEILEKLHNVLEMVMMFKVFLPLPLHVMSLIMKRMMHHFEDSPVLEDHTFEFPVPAVAVQSILGSNKPCVWKAELVNAASTESKRCFLSTSRPFHHLQGVADEEEEVEDSVDGENETKRPSYFMVIKQESIV
ncbi:protein zwilch homolog [Gigantopelta aegis]|uniref:protein zwilch homolog n=1 Tax=Gigantopelta aegis TaxID=1735272 RepID=UPI001B887E5E|nr:protein zwilch homolog [Gigantopelta aegis]